MSANETAFDNCLSVSPACPISETTLGYRPSLPANAFFVAIFAICLVCQLIAGIKWKTWTWMIAIALGSMTQVIGYAGRLIMNSNPWDGNGFTMQITCLIIAPAFTTAAIYLTLKHFVIAFGSQHSFLKPNLYTWIFVSGDILSLVIQGVGGGIAAASDTHSDAVLGAHIMLAGIIFQVVWLAVFATLCAVYFTRVWRNPTTDAVLLARSGKFRVFAAGVMVAYTAILVRCIYRIPELASGWGSELFQDETDFIVLDGVMMAVATVALTVCHPGIFFPRLGRSWGEQAKAGSEGWSKGEEMKGGVRVV